MRSALVVLITIVLLAVAQNVAASRYLERSTRLSSDFSAAALELRIRALSKDAPETVLLGDSALWGYGLRADATAAAILRRDGCRCVNFSFKGSSPPNYYALAKLLTAAGVPVKMAVLEVNQATLSPGDAAYKTLSPGVAELAGPLLSSADRGAIVLPATGERNVFDRLLASSWLVYGARADLRLAIAGDEDVVPSRTLTADDFLGTYDLEPLREDNVGVHYLEQTIDVLRSAGIPVAAFLTPTNHALLHEYIDVPAYRANESFLTNLLARRGVEVVDLDRAFPSRVFIDNAHLTAAGQTLLAQTLAKDIRGICANQANLR